VEEVTDEPLYRDRVCGIDIGKAGLVATIRVPSGKDPARRSPGVKFPRATRRIQTQAGMPIIRVGPEAVDLKVLAVPLACPMRWSAKVCHGHSRPTPQASRPGLTHLSRGAQET
jgi:hypothetical protein